ncbi:MAG: hypothetical protein ACLQSR_13590 [Limisphaerales bacterium]
MIDSTARNNKWRQKLGAVLPHEWVFDTFLLLTGLRLFVHGGAARDWSFVFLWYWLADKYEASTGQQPMFATEVKDWKV